MSASVEELISKHKMEILYRGSNWSAKSGECVGVGVSLCDAVLGLAKEIEARQSSPAFTTLDKIEAFGLLVRPSVLTRGWIAGKLKGITGHEQAQAYCWPETVCEAKTINEAVNLCVLACHAGGWRANQ